MSARFLTASAAHRAAVAEVRDACSELYQVYEPDPVQMLREHHQDDATVRWVGLEMLTEARQRSIPDRQAATSPQNWLSQLLALSPAEAKRRVRVAEALTSRWRATAAAFAAGQIDDSQADAIVSLLDALPAGATHEHKQRAEEFLLRSRPSSTPRGRGPAASACTTGSTPTARCRRTKTPRPSARRTPTTTATAPRRSEPPRRFRRLASLGQPASARPLL
jgi:hypothetical protein